MNGELLLKCIGKAKKIGEGVAYYGDFYKKMEQSFKSLEIARMALNRGPLRGFEYLALQLQRHCRR
jgi:hypothetical protein